MSASKLDGLRPATRIQRTIARRMAASHADVPDFALEVDVDMEPATLWRAAEKAAGRLAPSYNDMVVRAGAVALGRHPKANASWADGSFAVHGEINIGVAVAAEEALVVPVVRGVDDLTMAEIATEVRRLAGAVRDGTIKAEDLADGTFTISNLGMFGVDRFDAMVNQPQAAILAVGAVGRHPVAIGDEVAVHHRLTLTLSCDHRVLYGAEAAAFLSDVCGLLQEPRTLDPPL
jgi:pyruvate dehydrogenase E2 component (dihydrolipoamide acetyltransferase)